MTLTRYMVAFCLFILLNGCVALFLKPYGYVPIDHVPILPHLKRAHIPPEAPSISQGYNPEPKTGIPVNNSPYHEGIDIIDAAGTPVLATAPGKVIAAYFEPFYGRRIVIQHGQNEDGLYLRSKYFHLQSKLVKRGDQVVRGQKIGTLGRSGLLSGGFSHLHFEIRASSNPDQYYYDTIHPHKFWFDGVGNITCFNKNRVYPDTPFRTTYPVPCMNAERQDQNATKK